MKWISIEKKMPPLETDIIVLGKNIYTIYRGEPAKIWHVNLNKKYKEKALSNFLHMYEITHYFIIPPIPTK